MESAFRRVLQSRGSPGPPGDAFRPLEPTCTVVQFAQPLTPVELAAAGALFNGRPDVQLYVYGNAARDLEFLEFFTGVRRLHVALFALESTHGIRHVSESLEELILGQTRRSFSCGFLKDLPQLRSLFLVGHTKEIAAISQLRELQRLGLSQITLPDLELLLPLTELRALSVLLGGTRNLSVLPRLKKLEELFLMRITKLAGLDVLGDLVGLKKVRLDWMRNVTMLPDLGKLCRLEHVTLDTMKALHALLPVASAPALRHLSVTNMPQLTPDAFHCLKGHPTLTELWCYTGRQRVNDAVRQMFPGIAT